MPIYEFECEKCGKKFERLVLSKDEKNPGCPKCSCEEARKVMSAGCKVTMKGAAGYGGSAPPSSCAPGG